MPGPEETHVPRRRGVPRKSTRGKRPPARPAFGTATAALGPATPSGGTVTSGGELGAARWGKWPPAVSLAGGELSAPGQPRNPRLPPSGRPRALACPGRAGVDLAPSRSNQRAGGRAPRLRVPAAIAAPRRLLPAGARLSLLPVLRQAAGGAPRALPRPVSLSTSGQSGGVLRSCPERVA